MPPDRLVFHSGYYSCLFWARKAMWVFSKQKAEHHWTCTNCTDPLSDLSIHHFTLLEKLETSTATVVMRRWTTIWKCLLLLLLCHCRQCILLTPCPLSSSLTPTHLMPSFTSSINLLFGSLQGLVPANSNPGILPLTKSLLCTCPNHISLASLASTIKDLTCTNPLMFWFPILSILVTP